MLKDMCAEAGVAGNFTNHSLRAYGAITLYNANLPEKLILERTGHRSLKALRQFECTSEWKCLTLSVLLTKLKSLQ